MTLRRPKCPNDPRAASEKSLSRTRVNARYVPVAPRTFSLPRGARPVAGGRTAANASRAFQQPEALSATAAAPEGSVARPYGARNNPSPCSTPPARLFTTTVLTSAVPAHRAAKPKRFFTICISIWGERASSNWVLARGAPSTSSPATARLLDSSSEIPSSPPNAFAAATAAGASITCVGENGSRGPLTSFRREDPLRRGASPTPETSGTGSAISKVATLFSVRG